MKEETRFGLAMLAVATLSAALLVIFARTELRNRAGRSPVNVSDVSHAGHDWIVFQAHDCMQAVHSPDCGGCMKAK